MNNSVGLGGITLIVAAVVWLMIFVPGYTRRSQVKESTAIARAEQKRISQSTTLSPDERLRRLINTQRMFSVSFAIFLLGSIASAVASIANSMWWVGFWIASPMALLSLVTQRAAGSQASKLAMQRHRAKQSTRERAQKTSSRPVGREWTPNPLPAPLIPSQAGELAEPLADVVAIQKPKNSLSGSEIDAILARRRAI